MENSRRFPLILDGFWIKILAILTMTIDHIGVYMPASPWTLAFRYIGRLALPLFIFMVVEGALHTKNFKKYALRIGVMAAFISITFVTIELIPGLSFSIRNFGNIFLDLLLGALAVSLIDQKNWAIKALALLPIAYGIASFTADALEFCGCYGKILWFPYFLRTQYGFFGILLSVGFYVAKKLADVFILYQHNTTGIDLEIYDDSDLKRHAQNLLAFLALGVVSFILYVTGSLMPYKFVNWDLQLQAFAVVSGVFILLYNGRRGYNKKWFKYGAYLYYPIHLAILYLIFSLI